MRCVIRFTLCYESVRRTAATAPFWTSTRDLDKSYYTTRPLGAPLSVTWQPKDISLRPKCLPSTPSSRLTTASYVLLCAALSVSPLSWVLTCFSHDCSCRSAILHALLLLIMCSSYNAGYATCTTQRNVTVTQQLSWVLPSSSAVYN